MGAILLAVFMSALAAIVVLTILDGRRQRASSYTKVVPGSQSDWSTVAKTLELELSPWTTPDEASMRGTIDGHWVSVEQQHNGLEIVVNYRSGLHSFTASEPNTSGQDLTDRYVSGDQAFDSQVAIFTHAPAELENYLTPARRNALLWLQSAFTLGDIDHEMLDVLYAEPSWQPGQLTSAIQLVIDVAGIMEAGEKVFMAPPTREVAVLAEASHTSNDSSTDTLVWGPRLIEDDPNS